MKYLFFIIYFCLSCFLQNKSNAQNNWLYLSTYPSYASSGDLDVTGNQITVEAIFYALPNQRYDLVSKHGYSTDLNYLLRTNYCAVTTNNGYFFTNNVSVNLNQCYHVALTYNGQKLRYYQNGCLKSEVNATGNLITNNYPLRIGQIADPAQISLLEQYYGYIDEVRIWNVCRTQQQIASNMTNLPNPATQTGLLAYYKFENNYINSQGNTIWNLNNNVSSLFSLTPAQTIPPLLTVNLGNDTSICQGSIIALNAGNTGNTYLWNTNQTTQSINVSNPGTYIVTVTNANGCVGMDTITISSLQVNLGNDTSVCQGNPIVLNAGNPGCSYLWNTSQTSQTINVTNTGVYTVLVTNGTACTGKDTISVIVNPNPADINDSTFVSNHGILAHYPFDNHTYDISGHNYHGVLNGPVATADRFVIPNKALTYNGNNQSVNVPYDIWSDELSLSAWVYPTDLGSTDPTQTGKMIFFKAPNTGVNQDYTLAIAYINSGFRAQFVFGQGASQFFYVNSNTIIQTNQWYLITATRKNGVAKLYINGNLDNSAIYAFTPVNQHFNLKLGMSHASYQSFTGKLDDLRIYKRELCSHEVKSLYHKQYLLKVKLQDTVLCNNGSTFLQIINPEPGIKYQLYSSPLNIPIGSPQKTYCDSVLLLPTGTITSTSYFTILATDTVTGCSNLIDSIFKVSISPKVVVQLGNDTSICQGNTVVLNAGNPGCSYLWSSGQNTQSINVTLAGVYSVIVSSPIGCKGYDTINLGITTLLPVNLGNDTTICIGESLLLNAGNPGASFLWSSTATSQTINVNTAGVYWVAVNKNGCTGSDTISVFTVPQPVISLGNDTIMCPGELIILSPGLGFSQYLWSTGANTASINVNIPGIYSVTVSNGACSITDEIYIEECGSEIWIPNVFSPNGDGINETFYPVCFNIDKISMVIYNRWGNQIFEASGKACIWDGKLHNKLCPNGVYYYLIEYERKGKNKGPQIRHGSVTLLR